MISKKRVKALRKAINQLKKMKKMPNLQGNRPYVAVEMQLQVLQVELARALAGKEPLYKYQWYSEL